MRQINHNTTKLPRQLLEEIGSSVRDYGGKKRKRPRPADRKEQRKAARKQKRSSHIPRNKLYNQKKGSDHDSEDDLPQPSVVVKHSRVPVASVQPKAPESILKVPKSAPPRKERPNKIPQSSPSPSPPPKIPRAVQDRLAADDAEIAALERALGVKGRKKLPKSFEDDGLDSLLEGIDDAVGINHERPSKRKRDEEERWLQNKRQKAEAEISHTEGSETSDKSGDNASLLGSGFQGLSEDDDEVERGTNVEDDDNSDLSNNDGDQLIPATIKKRSRENPYVAPVADGSVKYIPLSLRNRDRADVQDLSRLRRQLQGLLNRLSEANILSILSDIEKFYRDHPRQHVSSTLLDLLMGLLSDPTALSDTFIILHAGFIAAVYKVIGTDFAAQAIQRIEEEFEQSSTAKSESNGIGKKLTNLIGLLTELYNFQVVGSALIYDFIRLCLKDLSETNTELLLRITRSAGPQLRQDDSSSLKDIVLQLQSSVARVGEESLSVRTKFMIETIKELKNNRIKRGNVATVITSEHTVRMKKTLGSLNTRSLKASEPLRICLKDLRNRDKVGTWWLVGASYRGENRDLDDPNGPAKQPHVDRYKGNERKKMGSISSDLVLLAKDQRMNTDVRRSIFVAIMSSSDHNDAFIRLMKLRLKKSQEFEITKVLIHCAGAEKAYNPFYTFLSRRLCSDKKLKMSFQFSLWDSFKQMGEGEDESGGDQEDEREGKLELRSLVNLAKMFGVLVAESGLGLGVLKNLSLAYLQPKTQMFVEILMVTAILHCQQDSKGGRNEKVLLDIFLKPKEIPGMAGGLQYFLKKVVRKTDLAGSMSDRATVKWACTVACDALASSKMETVIDE